MSSSSCVRVAVTGAVLLACLTVSGWCQPDLGMEWFHRFDGQGQGEDRAEALAIDPDGHAIVAGFSTNADGNRDYTVIKYDVNGDTLWTRYFDGPAHLDDECSDIAVDTSGSVYVTGTVAVGPDSSSFATIKYSSTGDTLWVRYFSGPLNPDTAVAIKIRADGLVYVSGTSGESWDNSRYVTLLYSPAGDLQWARTYNGPADERDRVRTLAVDHAGNAYVTGESTGSAPNSDAFTIAYGPSGDTLWTRRYISPANHGSLPLASHIGQDGSVLVAGTVFLVVDEFDMLTLKYSSAGDELWDRIYHHESSSIAFKWDVVADVETDSQGNVFVTGQSNGGPTGWDYSTLKYSPTGEQLWVRLYSSQYGGAGDHANELAVDADGSVYVMGVIAAAAAAEDIATIKYSADGDPLWTRRFGSPDKLRDVAWNMSLDGDGNLYVAGVASFAFGGDILIIKYSEAAALAQGDVNCDGIIDLADVVFVGNVVDSLITAAELCDPSSADLDHDGDVDGDDYTVLYDNVAWMRGP